MTCFGEPGVLAKEGWFLAGRGLEGFVVVCSIQKIPTRFIRTWAHTVDLGDRGRNQMKWSHHYVDGSVMASDVCLSGSLLVRALRTTGYAMRSGQKYRRNGGRLGI